MRFPNFEGEWKVKKLGEVCEIKTGNKDTQNKVENGKYPFFVRSNTVEKIDSYSYDGEAILTSGDGVGVGKNFHYINGKFDFHQRVYALRNFRNGYSGKYIYHLFSEKFYDRVRKLSAKNSVDSVRMDMISEMKVYFPLLLEQQKISSFLSLIDERIQTQNKIINDLKTLKTATAKKIFSGELRFKDDNGNDFSEWEDKKLGDISIKKSSNISANTLEENQGNFKIYGANGLLKEIDFYREEKPYIAIVKDGAGVGRLLLCEGKSSVLGTLDIIKNKEQTDLLFLYYLLETIDFTKFTTGSTIPHIYFKDYSKEIIGLPSFPEQTKIANFLSSIDSKSDIENQLLQKLEAQKKYLLQNIFV